MAVDDVAARIRAACEPAHGSCRTYSALTRIEDDGEDIPDARAMIADLVRAHETVVRTAREAIYNNSITTA